MVTVSGISTPPERNSSPASQLKETRRLHVAEQYPRYGETGLVDIAKRTG
jgi:hypothetical protein